MRVVSACCLLLLLSGVSAQAANATFKVIVHPSVAGRTIPRDVLAKIYLGTLTRWGNGDAISPVDLSSTSPVRKAFSDQVLGMSVDAVMHQWLRKISSSARSLPPKSKATDDEVIAFVASQQGGVGYVSATAVLPATVREVGVE
jgi:ABC-type phosphate transport system substrate-binding protein